MDKKRYIKWYRLAKDSVNDPSLILERSDKEVMNFVSEANWLMFSPLTSINEAKSSSLPNIYFDLAEDENRGLIGLTFNTVKAVDRLKNILSEYSGHEKKMLLDELLKLDNVWEIRISRKIKDRIFSQQPKWKIEFSKKTNKIDDTIIDEIIETSNRIRQEGTEKREEIKSKHNKFYLETPEISLMVCEFDLSEDNFVKRIKEAARVLKICLAIKTDSQIRKLERTSIAPLMVLTKPMRCPTCNNGIRGRVLTNTSASCGVCHKEFPIKESDIDN